MRINVSERFFHPTAGGLLLPEEILLIRQKATRTACPLCVFHCVFRGVAGLVWGHGCYVPIYLKTLTWMSVG